MKCGIHRAMSSYNSNKRKAARLDFKSDLYGGLGKTKKSEKIRMKADLKRKKAAKSLMRVKTKEYKAYIKMKNDKLKERINKINDKITKVDVNATKHLHKQSIGITKGQFLLFPTGPIGMKIYIGESKYDRYQNKKKDLRKGQAFYRKMLKENNRTISQVQVEQERWKKWA